MVNVLRPKVLGVRGTSAFLHGVDFSVDSDNYHSNAANQPGCVDFLAQDCAVTDYGDDGVTTHWSGPGMIVNPVCYNGSSSYSTSSNGVEIDDGSHDITILGGIVRNVDFGVLVKGHDGRQCARRITVIGTQAENCTSSGFAATASTASHPGEPPDQVVFDGVRVRDSGAAFESRHYRSTRFSNFEVRSCGKLFASGTPSTDANATRLIELSGGTVTATPTAFNLSNVGAVRCNNVVWSEYGGAAKITVSMANVELIDCEAIGETGNSAGLIVFNTGSDGFRLRGGSWRNSFGAGIRVAAAVNGTISDTRVTGSDSAGALYIPSGSAIDGLVVQGVKATEGARGFRFDNSSGIGLIADNFVKGTTADIQGAPTGFLMSRNILTPGVQSDQFNPLVDIGWLASYWASDPQWTAPGNGVAVNSWRDGSGRGRAVVQATGTAQPLYIASAINSKPAIRFDGTDDVLSVLYPSVAQPLTLVAIAKFAANPTTTRRILGTGGATIRGIGSLNAGGNWAHNYSVSASGGTVDSSAHLITSVANNTSSVLYIDGVSTITGDTGTGGVAMISIGAGSTITGPAYNYYFAGDVAFVGYYSGDLTTNAKWPAFKSWVNSTYGITVS